MKIFALIILSVCFFINSCAQQKFEKPPKPGKDKNYKIHKGISPTKIKKGHLILNLGELKQKGNSLYCWEADGKCNIIDGKITLITYYQTSGDDNPKLIPYNFAEGEFLEGKYQGIWKYYNEKKIIKKERWNNGKLVYRKEYK